MEPVLNPTCPRCGLMTREHAMMLRKPYRDRRFWLHGVCNCCIEECPKQVDLCTPCTDHGVDTQQDYYVTRTSDITFCPDVCYSCNDGNSWKPTADWPPNQPKSGVCLEATVDNCCFHGLGGGLVTDPSRWDDYVDAICNSGAGSHRVAEFFLLRFSRPATTLFAELTVTASTGICSDFSAFFYQKMQVSDCLGPFDFNTNAFTCNLRLTNIPARTNCGTQNLVGLGSGGSFRVEACCPDAP